LGQNLALGFTEELQELHTGPLELFGINAGSGRGSSPGVENAAAADIIDGGCPGPGNVETDT
jgi:hypothetical protein